MKIILFFVYIIAIIVFLERVSYLLERLIHTGRSLMRFTIKALCVFFVIGVFFAPAELGQFGHPVLKYLAIILERFSEVLVDIFFWIEDLPDTTTNVHQRLTP